MVAIIQALQGNEDHYLKEEIMFTIRECLPVKNHYKDIAIFAIAPKIIKIVF